MQLHLCNILFGNSIWVIYDFCIGSYVAALMDAVLVTSAIVAICRLDIFKKNRTIGMNAVLYIELTDSCFVL